MANFVNLNDIQNSKIFFDTNILIYILCPISNSKKNYTEKFSNYFKKIIKSNNEIYIDILIISEFVNRCLKIEESKYREEMKIKNFNFKKDFRNTEKYKEVIKSIYENLKVFFKLKVKIYNFDYSKYELLKIFDKNIELDFNDRHIVKICEKEDMYLLTNDNDFINTNLKLVK